MLDHTRWVTECAIFSHSSRTLGLPVRCKLVEGKGFDGPTGVISQGYPARLCAKCGKPQSLTPPGATKGGPIDAKAGKSA
jgi:hypothetical protein